MLERYLPHYFVEGPLAEHVPDNAQTLYRFVLPGALDGNGNPGLGFRLPARAAPEHSLQTSKHVSSPYA
jgi:hypothetical protein